MHTPPPGPLVQQHIQDQEKMINLEKTHRQGSFPRYVYFHIHVTLTVPDHIFRQNLSPVAQHADQIVAAIRQREIEDYWRVPGTPEEDDSDERFTGEMFPWAKLLISNTTLWKVVKRMPKGALLHAHLSAMLPYEKIVETIIHTEGMVISASQPLVNDEVKQNLTISFAHVNLSVPTGQPCIHESNYVSNTQVPIKRAADSFPGGQEGFPDFIRTKATDLPSESTWHELGVDDIWRRFQACFGPAGTMIQYEPVVRTFYQKLFTSLVDDGISWVEIRAGGSSEKLVHDGDEDVDPDLDA